MAIAAGTKEKTTGAYTSYRNFFYGATEEKPTLDSAYIRGLTKSNKAYAAGTITINVPAGAQRVAIACLADEGYQRDRHERRCDQYLRSVRRVCRGRQ